MRTHPDLKFSWLEKTVIALLVAPAVLWVGFLILTAVFSTH